MKIDCLQYKTISIKNYNNRLTLYIASQHKIEYIRTEFNYLQFILLLEVTKDIGTHKQVIDSDYFAAYTSNNITTIQINNVPIVMLSSYQLQVLIDSCKQLVLEFIEQV